MTIHDYRRTQCGCRECIACCVRQPGPLAPGDLEAIAAHRGQTVAEVSPLFRSSNGSLAATIRNGGLVILRIKSITPMRGDSGACVFLSPAGLCEIHAVSPAGCRYFDPHMGQREGRQRAEALVRAQMDPAYQALRETLEPV